MYVLFVLFILFIIIRFDTFFHTMLTEFFAICLVFISLILSLFVIFMLSRISFETLMPMVSSTIIALIMIRINDSMFINNVLTILLLNIFALWIVILYMHNHEIIKCTHWQNLSIDEQRDIIKCYYKIKSDTRGNEYVTCYKVVTVEFKSVCADDNFVYDGLYETYVTDCDYDRTVQNSYGFDCWTKRNAIKYGKSVIPHLNSHVTFEKLGLRLIKVKIPIDSLCIVDNTNGKIRTSQFIIKNLYVKTNKSKETKKIEI